MVTDPIDAATAPDRPFSPLRRAAERIATASAVHWDREIEPFLCEVMGIIEDELRPSAMLAELHEFLGRLAEERHLSRWEAMRAV